MREVLEDGEASREELLRRVERFARIAVLRPDGYLAWGRNGRAQQKVAPVEWRDGAFRAGLFELGRFYVSNGSVLQLANEWMEPVVGPMFVEVYDDADVISRTLDGAEEAFVELYHALGQLLTHPLDSITALRDLPAGVAVLIASSPEYWERFRYMTAGEQMKAVARLTTNPPCVREDVALRHISSTLAIRGDAHTSGRAALLRRLKDEPEAICSPHEHRSGHERLAQQGACELHNRRDPRFPEPLRGHY